MVANGAMEGGGDGSVGFGEGGEEFLIGGSGVIRFGAHLILILFGERQRSGSGGSFYYKREKNWMSGYASYWSVCCE